MSDQQEVDWPIQVNLPLDPFERTRMSNGKRGSLAYYDWSAYELWRFDFVRQDVAKAAERLIKSPLMQMGVCFNLEALKEMPLENIAHASR